MASTKALWKIRATQEMTVHAAAYGWTQQHLTSNLEPPPDAFNFGLNDGQAAGQTIAQFHFHIIPRYAGDIPDPRGGIRHIIPTKARYR